MDAEEIKNQPTADAQVSAVEETEEKFNPNWASDAPRGGRAVLTRILKESATVPLFFAQTLIQSLRDVGYNTTTSALLRSPTDDAATPPAFSPSPRWLASSRFFHRAPPASVPSA
jgi:hypothetical protein